MTCTSCHASGQLLLCISFGVLRHLEIRAILGQRRDFAAIVLTPPSCRELIFSTCAYVSDEVFCVLLDKNSDSACIQVGGRCLNVAV